MATLLYMLLLCLRHCEMLCGMYLLISCNSYIPCVFQRSRVQCYRCTCLVLSLPKLVEFTSCHAIFICFVMCPLIGYKLCVECFSCTAAMLQVVSCLCVSANITRMFPNHSNYSDSGLCWPTSYLSRVDVYWIFVVSYIAGF